MSRQDKRQTIGLIVSSVSMLAAVVAITFALGFGVFEHIAEMKTCAGMSAGFCLLTFAGLQYM